MDDAWFVGEGGTQQGPFTRAEVDGFVASGRVARTTLVWRQGMARWAPAEEAGLFVGRAPGIVPAAGGLGPVAVPGASPGLALRRYLENYATFTGRASRAEFWWMAAILAVAHVVAATADVALAMSGGFAFVSGLLALATFVPSTAVTVRRLHDGDRSGWWVLLTFVPLVGLAWLFLLCAARGTNGPNRYGATL